MTKRKTFPEISTMELLDNAGLKYLHHVYLEDPSSKFKRRSEIDFIVFHKRGLLLLEAKGGDRYERSTEEQKGKINDVWTYFEGEKKLYSQKKSPFDQVTENLEDFRRVLCERDESFRNICFARGVVFPDLKFSDAGVLQNDSQAITFDVDSNNFSEFVDSCFDAEYEKKETNFYSHIQENTMGVIKDLLFPNEPKTVDQPHEFRDYSLNKIKNYLFGPAWNDPTQIKIDVFPGELFSTGILHPLEPLDDPITTDLDDEEEISEFSESDESNISKNFSTAEENTDNEVASSHSIMRPSSAGMYFSIPKDSSVEITYGYSTYKKDENNRWTRIHFTGKKTIKLDKKRYNPILTENESITLELRSHFRDSIQHAGIYLVNRSNDNIYQVGLKAKLVDSQLLPQEPIFDDFSDGNLFDDIKIYGSGKGVAVDWSDDLNEIWIDFIPEYDVAKIESKSNNDSNLSIKYLADPESNLSQSDYEENLTIFANSYSSHLEKLAENSLSEHQQENLIKAKNFSSRIKKGIHYLSSDKNAFDAFKLMNLSILTMFARKSKYQGKNFYDTDPDDRQPTWYAFQIAFCLAALPGIIDPISEKDDREIVDLIWFPTGGGKTESYLALLSFTILFRRLKNPQNIGTTVIMRYTLRLLVQDQFSRLASLTVAMDYIRKEKFGGHDLGNEQITLGYWVGKKASPKSIKDASKVVSECLTNKAKQLPFVLDRCPWCDEDLISLTGSAVTAYASHLLDTHNGKPACTNNECGYSATDKSGLPVVLWEDEILKNPPTIIIGTVDNFAKLSWYKYDTQNLFGITQNGYECSPPDLIIQDELHLISGPLGSLVGLYDQLLRTLCSREHPVKIAVSTATISNADQQISRLYGNRSHQVVPPPEIKWGDSFFMSTNNDPKLSRKYLGVFNGSLSPVVSSINTASALLQSSAFRPDISKSNDQAIDPFKTLVWYFNSIRELAYSISSRWNIESRVNYLANNIDKYLGKKFRRKFEYANLQELTSRRSASEIKTIKEKLTIPFKQNYEEGDMRSVDVLFATNMISVGVDIERLGLMMVNGLPKTSSEYIQASSRVGRKHPGLVITTYNINKSRDRSHYEYFRSMHEGLYRYVEPTSVTPFSAGARKKGLAGVFFAYLMHIHPTEDPTEFSLEHMNQAKKWIIDIVSQVHPDESIDVIDSEINQIIKSYKDNQDIITEWGNMVGNDDSTITSLMGTFSDSKKKSKRHVFDILTSLRNVDRDVSVRIFSED